MDGDKEDQWFRQWTPAVESLLEPYRDVAASLGLRAAEIQERVQHVLCTRILRHAMRHHPEAWAQAPALLTRDHALSETLGRLFGHETPASVAGMVLRTLLQQSEEHDERQDVLTGRAIRSRAPEDEQLWPPRYVWVVRILGRDETKVSVESRSQLRDNTVGLVRVVDAR